VNERLRRNRVLGVQPGSEHGAAHRSWRRRDDTVRGGLFDPAIVSSPDGANVYGVDGQSNALLQYAPSTGGVVQQQTYPVLADPTIAKDPITLATSPDGSSVYVLTYGVQFTRNATTGGLMFDGAVVEGSGDVTGLADARDVAVSPDGKNVYVASPGDGGVAVFIRNPTTCVPTFVQLAQDLFTIAPPTVNQKDGTATLPVNVDTSGTLTSSVQPLASNDSARAATDGAGLISVNGPTTVALPISLSGQAQDQLDKHRKLSVNVAVTFTASGGTPTTKTATVQLVTAAPAVSKLRVSPRKFSLAGRLVKTRCVGATNSNNADKSCRRPISLRVSYRLNVAADVVLTLKRQTAGRRGARFVEQRGKITLDGKAGANQFVFKGKIGGHILGSGAYQLIATPTGGRATKVTFQILP
jgi:hypothetical protein